VGRSIVTRRLISRYLLKRISDRNTSEIESQRASTKRHFTNVTANLIFWLGLGVIVGITARFGQRNSGSSSASVATSTSPHVFPIFGPRRLAIGQGAIGWGSTSCVLGGNRSTLRHSFIPLAGYSTRLVDTIWTGSRVYEFRTAVSPAKTDNPYEFDHLADNIIVVGAASKNSIRRLYIDSNMV
jgi:hypothetical protein